MHQVCSIMVAVGIDLGMSRDEDQPASGPRIRRCTDFVSLSSRRRRSPPWPPSLSVLWPSNPGRMGVEAARAAVAVAAREVSEVSEVSEAREVSEVSEEAGLDQPWAWR